MTKTLAQTIAEALRSNNERVYLRRGFPSKSVKGLTHEVVLRYGGSFERPNIECDCVKFQMSNPHWCKHTSEVWDGCDGMAKTMCVKHDEIYEHNGWRT